MYVRIHTFLSIGNIVPKHLLPYESELGANVTTETLIPYVCHMDKRPSIPQHWKLLSQVFLHQVLLTCTCSFCFGYENKCTG